MPHINILLACVMQIDEEILQEVVKMGFDRNQLVESLRNRVQNEVSTFTTHFLYHFSPVSLVAAYFRVLLHTICYWITDSVFPVAILELSSRKPWYFFFSYFLFS